ncbi:TAXI family TRAP transporter solute-binding subunit [Bacillus sp. Marseille-P3661]|uniref:TAXI family TRAP transporter solute-binding subunit n=1 Tax=Bacillus sp. Marseille-P3661 TaxID=1936234 RepID=UPI000C83134A|nr:TAXI family TRAP transporter solute-binding subunit [Bacillus sp. Marseille-P3661]
MEKKSWFIKTIMLSCLFILFLAGCGGNAEQSSTSGGNESSSSTNADSNTASGETEAPKFITMGTAASGSSIFAYGTGLTALLSQKLTYSQFDAEETGGTIANLKVMDEGKMEMAIGGGDAYYNAQRMQGGFDKVPNGMLGWKVAPSTIQFVALEKSGIKKIEDLKGKRISIGSSGSAGNSTAISILELHGVKESDVTISYLGWGEAMTALADGAIDATLILGTLPAPVVSEVAVREPVQLINVDPEKMKANPVFTTRVVAAGTYDNQAEDSTCAVVDQYIYFSPDLPEDVVYDITKIGMESTEELAKSHPIGKVAEPISKELAEFLEGEVHPGTIKYYKEIGAWE